jgi:hypothetical protein
MLPDHAAQSYTIAEVEIVIFGEGMSLHDQASPLALLVSNNPGVDHQTEVSFTEVCQAVKSTSCRERRRGDTCR